MQAGFRPPPPPAGHREFSQLLQHIVLVSQNIRFIAEVYFFDLCILALLRHVRCFCRLLLCDLLRLLSFLILLVLCIRPRLMSTGLSRSSISRRVAASPDKFFLKLFEICVQTSVPTLNGTIFPEVICDCLLYSFVIVSIRSSRRWESTYRDVVHMLHRRSWISQSLRCIPRTSPTWRPIHRDVRRAEICWPC